MSVHFITSPTEGKIYLIKRKVGGAKSNRFEPSSVQKIEVRTTDQGFDAGFQISVCWMNDNVLEEGIAMYHGLIKELTLKWLRDEKKRTDTDLKSLAAKSEMIGCLENYLTFPVVGGQSTAINT